MVAAISVARLGDIFAGVYFSLTFWSGSDINNQSAVQASVRPRLSGKSIERTFSFSVVSPDADETYLTALSKGKSSQ